MGFRSDRAYLPGQKAGVGYQGKILEKEGNLLPYDEGRSSKRRMVTLQEHAFLARKAEIYRFGKQ